MDEIVREFLVESHENLDQLDQDLVALESTPGSRELLSSIFRTIHTIKGTSGFLAFSRLEQVTHVGESLLVDLRDGRRSMDQSTTDVLLRLVDTVRDILAAIEHDGTEGAVVVDDVIAAIVQVQEQVPGEVAAAPAPVAEVPAQRSASVEPTPAPVVAVAAPEPSTPPTPPAPVAPEDSAEPEDVTEPELDDEPEVEPVPEPVAPKVVPATTVPSAAPVVPSPRAAAPAAAPAPAAALEEAAAPRTSADSSIRVDVGLLDALMRQVGELVLARNQISLLASGADDVELSRSAQRLNLIAGELQEGVMKTRMQPIDHVWSKMPRVVRDLSAQCEREVALEMIGGDTELDRGLLEAVKDPLTHLVRNAVDHGIEPPAERVAAGKPAKGVLTLRAFHEGGQVVVEVADDGRGIDDEKVAAKALQRGLRTADELAAMGPSEIVQLLFLPGFSLADTVTNVSGRGVGMDVVRTKIEAIGGTVDVETAVGEGTAWRLRIPLTLAIMPALTVECAGDLYAVPQVNLLELVALDSQRTDSAIEYVQAAPVYRLRGELLPLVSLAAVLRVDGPAGAAGAPPRSGNQVIAVVQADQQRFGLLVDRVLNTEEIVVKPLSSRLKTLGVYAGATVLGDGRVALILDVQTISRRALTSDVDLRRARASAEVVKTVALEQVLVVGIGGDRRVAMPLASVARLEHVRLSEVELVGGREVVQYRGTILPLIRLDRLLGGYGSLADPSDELLLVVYLEAGRSVAFVVAEILDIVDDDRSQHSDIEDAGLLGSTVIDGHVTELLDVRGAVLAADPTFYDVRVDASAVDPEPGSAGAVSRYDLVGAVR
ncbi:MAG TPA: chemotaxis protein CheA [Cellulomonas sp.]|uniref:chemotaxis protein CheA n=1 Tax=Cellulomonas sp. TaxID=40001 RepID=UPI002E3731DE|nr:chemotaxis protein CheA [Cellulomonas sp.]HEX5333927.1 chemotaxis protein CheA [Cellulomonas sp.]